MTHGIAQTKSVDKVRFGVNSVQTVVSNFADEHLIHPIIQSKKKHRKEEMTSLGVSQFT